MRHNKSGKVLGRTWEHRKAMFRNMAKSLVTYGRIRTTETKAKELRKVADNLVTLALRNDLHAKRQAYKVLGSHTLVKKLFDDYGTCFSGVQGGYTRVVKLALPRKGDCAPMAVIEFTRQPGEAIEEPQKKATKEVVAPVPAAPAVEQEAAGAADIQETESDAAADVSASEDAAPESTEDAASESSDEPAAETPAKETDESEKTE